MRYSRLPAGTFHSFSLRVVLGMALLAASVCAQTASTISGTVIDPSGALIPDAAVRLQGRATHEERSTKTDSSGVFRFNGVPYDSYQVEVQMSGFSTGRARVNAVAPQPRALRIALELAEVRGNVTVDSGVSRPSTEVANNLNTITIDREQLDTLPMLGGDALATISSLLAPGVSGGDSTILVDGVETRTADLRPSEIQNVRINQNPYSAEYSRPGGNRIEILTRVGTQDFHGSLRLNFRDSLFDARNPFAPTRPPQQHRMYDASLSGPLGSKKTIFNLSFWRDESDLQSVVYAVTPGGEVRANTPNNTRNTLVAARVARQFRGKDPMSLRYTYVTWEDLNQGAGGFVLPQAGFDTHNFRQNLTYAYTTVLSTNLVNDLSARAGQEVTRVQSLQPGVPQIVVLDAFTSGGAQVDVHRTDTSITLNDTLSWVRGRNSIRTGFSVPELERTGYNDHSNFEGTFSFSSLADYQLGRPFSFFQQEGNNRLVFHPADAAGFLQDDFQVSPNFSLGFGLRYEWQRYIQDYNNVAPRLSFAYAPGFSRKTVFRAGAGIFYDRASREAIADTLRFNGVRLRQIVLSNPGYPNPFAAGVPSLLEPASIVALDPNLRSPYVVDYSFGMERQFGKTTFTTTYTGQRYVKQFRSADLNAPLPPLYLGRPNPDVGVFRQIESSGRGERDALRISFRGNLTRFFSGTALYTLSRTYSNTEGIDYFPADQYNQSGEWSRTSNDQRHYLFLMGTLNAGSWAHFGIIASAGSGLPYSLTTGEDNNQDSRPTDRPPGIPRNSLELPWRKTLDVGWSKSFFFSPSRKEKGPSVSIGLDAFNILNRVNVTNIVGILSSPLFGVPVAAQPGRRVQLSAGFKF